MLLRTNEYMRAQPAENATDDASIGAVRRVFVWDLLTCRKLLQCAEFIVYAEGAESMAREVRYRVLHEEHVHRQEAPACAGAPWRVPLDWIIGCAFRLDAEDQAGRPLAFTLNINGTSFSTMAARGALMIGDLCLRERGDYRLPTFHSQLPEPLVAAVINGYDAPLNGASSRNDRITASPSCLLGLHPIINFSGQHRSYIELRPRGDTTAAIVRAHCYTLCVTAAANCSSVLV